MESSDEKGSAHLRGPLEGLAGRAVSSDELTLWTDRLLAVARLGALVPSEGGPALVTQDLLTPSKLKHE